MGRFFSGKQHLALRLQHATCRAQGCLVPAEWCEAHDQTYQVKLLPNGDVRFRRRT